MAVEMKEVPYERCFPKNVPSGVLQSAVEILVARIDSLNFAISDFAADSGVATALASQAEAAVKLRASQTDVAAALGHLDAIAAKLADGNNET